MKLYLIRFAISISLWRRGAKSECYFLMLVTPPPVSSQNANSPAVYSVRNRFAGRRRRNYLVTKGKNGGPHLESISIRHVRTKYSALHFSCSFSTTTIQHKEITSAAAINKQFPLQWHWVNCWLGIKEEKLHREWESAAKAVQRRRRRTSTSSSSCWAGPLQQYTQSNW